ncbi:ATP-binding protein [Kribbella sp. NPDC050459]|uniref:ATP-binding protein n=1 Tax=Kribbella sp. NPDC050459 TaxID=3155785 RepID=UPI0033C8481B
MDRLEDHIRAGPRDERFTRLDEARTRDAGGAGLGLAIAREIAHRHHGTLTASAPESGGSRFTLSMVAG